MTETYEDIYRIVASCAGAPMCHDCYIAESAGDAEAKWEKYRARYELCGWRWDGKKWNTAWAGFTPSEAMQVQFHT